MYETQVMVISKEPDERKVDDDELVRINELLWLGVDLVESNRGKPEITDELKHGIEWL